MQETVLVKASVLDEILDIVWDFTNVCPPIHDFNNEAYCEPCPKHGESESDYPSCAECWKAYAVATV